MLHGFLLVISEAIFCIVFAMYIVLVLTMLEKELEGTRQ